MKKVKKSKSSVSSSMISMNNTTLLISNSEKYHVNVLNTIKSLLKKTSDRGIYVTLNNSCKNIIETFDQNKIKHDNLFLIDGISKHAGKNITKDSNCFYIEGPQSLTEMSIAITTELNNKEYNFVLIDSLSTIMIYNDISTTEKFAHYIINKIKDWKCKLIIFTIDEENFNKLKNTITPFFDKVIKL